MVTEGRDYLSFENLGDLTAYILVSVCQAYYWGTGSVVNGYFFPDNDSNFKNFLLPTITILHLNLIV